MYIDGDNNQVRTDEDLGLILMEGDVNAEQEKPQTHKKKATPESEAAKQMPGT